MGKTATQVTQWLCPLNVLMHLPVTKSHAFSVLSLEPLTMFPLGKTVIQLTESLCPSNVLMYLPLVLSHAFNVLLLKPLTMLPLGKSATLAPITLNRFYALSCTLSHSFNVLSSAPLMILPLGKIATQVTELAVSLKCSDAFFAQCKSHSFRVLSSRATHDVATRQDGNTSDRIAVPLKRL